LLSAIPQGRPARLRLGLGFFDAGKLKATLKRRTGDE
jgi:hypothetical protein